ncbi:endonuclease, partial [Escherichia coli]|nr:endonuclease [Escherichia coli]
MVKNPNVQAHGQIYFHDIGDYLSREEKLEKVSEFNSVNGITKINGWQLIEPDKHNDWLNQRDERFNYFIEMGNKKDKDSVCIFSTYSRGGATSRDAWVYNFSAKKLIENVSEMIVYYNFQVNEKKKDPEFKEIIDTTRISWNRSLLNDFNKLKNHSFDKNCIYKSVYRPFNKSNLYFSRALNDMVYQMPQLFPTADSDNLVIYINGSGNGGKPFSALIVNAI